MSSCWLLVPSGLIQNIFFFCRMANIAAITTIVQFSSVTQSCLTLWDPMNHSKPSLPVHHQLPFIHSFQSLSRVRLFAIPWISAHQATLSITNSRSSPKLMSIKSVMPSSHLILCRPLLLLPPIPPSIRVFSNESTLRMRWLSTGVSALASFLPKNTQDWSPLEWTGWISLQSKGLSRVFSNTTVQKHQFFGAQLSSQSKIKIKFDTVSTVSPSSSHEIMGPDDMIFVFWMLSFKPTFSLSTFTSSRGFWVPLHFLP